MLGCFYFLFISCFAQNWEADVVRAINPENTSSYLWKYTNQSAKPISAGFPLALLATGIITKDKQLQNESYEMLGGLLVTIAATEGLKQVVNRPRPYQSYSGIYPNEFKDGKSFPSGHASVAFFTATSLSINHPKWYVVAPAFTWAAGVSYARLYYGQHNPTDLLASAIIGAGSAIAANRISNWMQRKKNTTTSTSLLP
ncbi:phosphatase PAP2 family protein [Aridibaculum aurantiacum]|uniref:phosphatase PAP2 family protein n=1 Tax=Aridibaculum aurantiacum TaxID=2810307 RepID=UPI001A97C2C9|nr:phosphatase PAP2 family protein [Aridibaculum aurantiacum]